MLQKPKLTKTQKQIKCKTNKKYNNQQKYEKNIKTK